MFLTLGWIKQYIDVPDNATNVEVHDLFGFWENDDVGYSRESDHGKLHTANGVQGVLVNLYPGGTVPSNKRGWHVHVICY